jgi:hypothetical protein
MIFAVFSVTNGSRNWVRRDYLKTLVRVFWVLVSLVLRTVRFERSFQYVIR